MKKKRKIWIPIVIIIVIFLLGLLLYEDDPEEYIENYESESVSEEDDSYFSFADSDETEEKFPRGTASNLSGTTVIATVLANDSMTEWTDNDADVIYNQKSYLALACDYLTENVANYGTKADFIYDWEQDEELYYEAKFDFDIVSNLNNCFYEIGDWIDTNIDSDYLMNKYSANNIIYMIMVNTDPSNEETSCTFSWEEGMPFPYEYCIMLVNAYYEQECPASYAHEILHTFGAPDLYTTGDGYSNAGITEEYIDYLKETRSNDLMYTVYNNMTDETEYSRITNEFTDLDAYYVGLIDECDTVEEWGFNKSEYSN